MENKLEGTITIINCHSSIPFSKKIKVDMFISVMLGLTAIPTYFKI